MKIQFLGTAAAEGYPALFCECENCKKARERGGKNIRSRSQSLIDDTILIDFCPDTYMHFILHNIDLKEIKHCIITHGHSDHFYESEVPMRGKGFSHVSTGALNFYAPKDVYKRIENIIKDKKIEKEYIVSHLVEPYKTYDIAGYKITPLPAVHAGYDVRHDDGTREFEYYPVTYIIEKGETSMLYHHDSDFYAEETIEFLKKRKKPFDLVTFDCTNALLPKTYVGHLGLKEGVEYARFFKENGLATEKTKFVVNHFSHNGTGSLYDDIKVTAEREGFIASYDGLTVEF